jgi:hypothetical protein
MGMHGDGQGNVGGSLGDAWDDPSVPLESRPDVCQHDPVARGRRNAVANHAFRSAREHHASSIDPGEPLSRQELAENVNRWVYEHTGKTVALDANYIGKLERGSIRWPNRQYRDAFRFVLKTSNDRQLGFHPPHRRSGRHEEEQMPVRRDDFLRLSTLMAVGTAVTGSSGHRQVTDARNGEEFPQWLAWELWHQDRAFLHESELPPQMAGVSPGSGDPTRSAASFILRDQQGNYSFAHFAFRDFFVAQRIFGEIVDGRSDLFARTQTSHDMDLIIREFVSRNPDSSHRLQSWMQTSLSPVLRVNSAGVLAKLGPRSQETDQVVMSLKKDHEIRHRYLTAVAARVLGMEWSTADRLAADAQQAFTGRGETRIPLADTDIAAARFAEEITNNHDGGARWCATVFLQYLSPSTPRLTRRALMNALDSEQNIENLRSIGACLAEGNPLGTTLN